MPMKLHVINTGYFKLDGGAMFGVVPKSIWNRFNPADDNNLCNWAMRCLLIEEGNRLILVDTGIGDKQDAKFFGHYHLNGEDSLTRSLNQAGFTEKDITDVLLTHLHFDHVGGSVIRRGDQLVPAFPNALYWSNPSHWDWAVHANDLEKASFLKENILPLQQSGQLRFIEAAGQPASAQEHAEQRDSFSPRGGATGARPSSSEQEKPLVLPATPFSENIALRFVYGHTEAMMLPQISYRGKTIVFMADLLPSTGHIPLPYVMAYDMFPLTTLKEKKSFLQEAVEQNYILFFEHDPVNECCVLQCTEKGIRSAGTFRFADL